MAEKKKNFTRNSVKIVGYLKENNLEIVSNSTGGKVIRGSLIVSTDKISSHKIQFYIPETTYGGEASHGYESMLELLPENTITIASYLKDNESADFDTAANASTKVWVMARLEEYASRMGERERSMVTLRGFKAGFSKVDKYPFAPCAEFDVDVYLMGMTPEVIDGKETGRLLMEGLLPKYDGCVDKIDFIAVSEDGVAKYINGHYGVGDTVNLKGDVISLQERQLVQVDDSEYFGRASAPQYETNFVRERRVVGGSKNPIHDGEEGSITKDFVKEGLVKREEKMEANGIRYNSRNGQNRSSDAPAQVKDTPQTDVSTDDLPF